MKKKFPYLQVRGSNRDVGFAIGETFRSKIQENVSVRKNSIATYKVLRGKSQNHFLETLHYFPKFIEELTATAIAANVGVMDLFFANTRSLYDAGVASETGELVIHDRCTSIVSFGKNGVIVGHNEDWDVANIDDLYILKAEIGDTSFIGINYAWELPGTSASMNSWGLVQCINEVHQKDEIGIPKNFLARAIMQSKSLAEAELMIEDCKQDTGFNHVLVQGNTVRDIEIAGGETDTFTSKNKPFVHTNHFVSDLKKYETYHTKSSDHRYSKAKELLKPDMTDSEIKAILSNHSDTAYPICRHESTMATLVFKPEKREVEICYGPPCKGKFKRYTL